MLSERGFHGASFYACPDLTVRNCVWVDNQINHFYVHNTPSEKVNFTRNIVLDNIPVKIFNNLMNFWNLESLNESYNCYYLRLPKEKRGLISYTRRNNVMERKGMTYPEFLKLTGTKETSLFRSPGLAAVPGILTYQSEILKKPGPMPEKKTFETEMKKLSSEFSKVELGARKNGYTPWDFSGFFATDPQCVKLKIGPDPELFKNGAAN